MLEVVLRTVQLDMNLPTLMNKKQATHKELVMSLEKWRRKSEQVR